MSYDVETEDRGTPCLIWKDEAGNHAFNWFPNAEPMTISVPVGWSLFADPELGAMLRSVFGAEMLPASAARRAMDRRDGFRIRKEKT